MNFTQPGGVQSGRQLSTNTQELHLQSINITASTNPGQAAINNLPQQIFQKIDLQTTTTSISSQQQPYLQQSKPIYSNTETKMNEDKIEPQMATPSTQSVNIQQQTRPQLQQPQNHSNGKILF